MRIALFQPLVTPPWVTRFEDRDGTVGERFFEELAREQNMGLRRAPPGSGIVDAADQEWAADSFRPSELKPIVREVYERTTALEFVAKRIDWTRIGKIRRFLFLKASLATQQQLQIPKDSRELPQVMKSEVGLLDKDRDGLTDHRVWLRYFERSGKLYYVAAVSTHKTKGPDGEQSYLDVILPLWRRNLAAVFQPRNLDGGGLTLRTHEPGSYDSGLYLVIPGRRRYFMMPFFGIREEIRLEPGKDEQGEFVEGTHTNWWRNSLTFTFRYTLRRSSGPQKPSTNPI